MELTLYIVLFMCIVKTICSQETHLLNKGNTECVNYDIISYTMAQTNKKLDSVDSKCENIEDLKNTVEQLQGSIQSLSGLQGSIDSLSEMFAEISDGGITSGKALSDEELKSHISARLNPPKGRYLVSNEMKTYSDAKAACQRYGMELVALNSVSELATVIGKIYNGSVDVVNCAKQTLGFWTSARDLGNDVWVWGDSNEAVLPSLWIRSPQQPDGDSDCAHIHTHYDYSFYLNDQPCSQQLCFVCESPNDPSEDDSDSEKSSVSFNQVEVYIDAILNNTKQQYLVFNKLKSFSDARAECQSYGGDLVSLNTMEEFEMVIGEIYTSGMDVVPCAKQAQGLWTSARDLGNDNWVWGDTDEPVMSSLWTTSPQQPSGDGDCAHIDTEYDYRFTLNDLPCSWKNCFVCEI